MRPALILAVAATAVVAFFGFESRVSACGGCFAPPVEFSAVDSHRMVIKLGLEETILWDQFIYSGEPEQFAWVLPVPSPDVEVEIASADFVQSIDVETTPIIQPASPSCDGAAGCGCGPEWSMLPGPVPGVEVYERAVVGPYETVTLGSEDPDALYTWLSNNGYAFPESAIPTLDHYIQAGSEFLVLRLAPGEGVSAMQPVRVRFRGFMGSFPLQMVVIGASGALDLSLWVVADQRYATFNYPNITVDENELVWDWATSSSNYSELFDDLIDRNGGRAWVTEYAGGLPDSELAAILERDAGADYDIATSGIDYPYLTRLRTRMLVEHIDQDLQLAPSEDAGEVPRELFARQDANYPCATGTVGMAAWNPARPGHAQTLLLIGLAFGLATAMLRRRRSSARRR